MLSFGIEYERAFSTAFCNARFPAGSAPPSLAATMIARVSFEKSLPRFASAAPFLCLIDDHLLCPDTHRLPYLVQKQLVHPRVVRQLRMERGDEDASLPRQHWMPVQSREDLDAGAGILDPRRPDEDRAQRLVPVADLQVGLETVHLPSERIPLDAEVGEAEMLAVEHDHAGAGAEDRRVEAPERLVEAVEPHQPRDRRRFAARDDQPVEPRQLVRQPHLDRLGAEAPQHRRMLAEVPLDCQHPDPHGADCKDVYPGCRRRSTSRPSRTKKKPTTP